MWLYSVLLGIGVFAAMLGYALAGPEERGCRAGAAPRLGNSLSKLAVLYSDLARWCAECPIVAISGHSPTQ